MMDSKELAKLNKKLHKIGNELIEQTKTIDHEVTQWLVIGANKIRNTIILSMRNTPKNGIHYKRGKKTHKSSSKGNPPAIDSGDLIRSIIFDARDLEVEVGSIIEIPAYPTFLEFGTDKMDARPWLDPAVKKHEDEIVNNVGKGIFEIIGKPFEGTK